MDELLEAKFKALAEAYPDAESQEDIAQMRKTIRLNDLTSKLRDNDAMKVILSEMEEELGRIEKELSTDETLFIASDGALRGRVLHARRTWLRKFLTLFDRAQATVDSVIKNIDYKLEQ